MLLYVSGHSGSLSGVGVYELVKFIIQSMD